MDIYNKNYISIRNEHAHTRPVPYNDDLKTLAWFSGAVGEVVRVHFRKMKLRLRWAKETVRKNYTTVVVL